MVRLRRLAGVVIAVVTLILVRSLGVAINSPWPLLGVIAAGSCGLYLALRLRRGLHGFDLGDELKMFAGAEFVLLIVLAPQWGLALRGNRLALALSGFPIVAHAALSACRAFSSPSRRAQALISYLLPTKMAPVLIAEMTILVQALLFWRRPRLRPGQRSFTSYGTLAPALLAVLAISIVEILVLHLLLSRISVDLAAVVTVIGAAGFLYIVGILKSLQSLPTIVGFDEVVARLGGLQEVRFAKANVADVTLLPPCHPVSVETAKLSGMSSPNVLIRLREPVRMKGPFGREKDVTALALRLDREREFIDSIS